MLGIAEEAYAASKLETEQREVRETAELVGIYWEQNASSARDCFSFLLDERTLPSRPEKQMLFSYRYQDGDGKTYFQEECRRRAGEGAGVFQQHRTRASRAGASGLPPAPARTALWTAALPRHGKTAARFSQTTTAASAHRASLTSWQRLPRKQRPGFSQDLRRTADGNVRSAGCRMAVAYFAQSAEPDALRKNKNEQQGGEEDLS